MGLVKNPAQCPKTPGNNVLLMVMDHFLDMYFISEPVCCVALCFDWRRRHKRLWRTCVKTPTWPVLHLWHWRQVGPAAPSSRLPPVLKYMATNNELRCSGLEEPASCSFLLFKTFRGVRKRPGVNWIWGRRRAEVGEKRPHYYCTMFFHEVTVQDLPTCKGQWEELGRRNGTAGQVKIEGKKKSPWWNDGSSSKWFHDDTVLSAARCQKKHFRSVLAERYFRRLQFSLEAGKKKKKERKILQINKASTQDDQGLQVETAGRCLCYGTQRTHGAQLPDFARLTSLAKIWDYIFHTGGGGEEDWGGWGGVGGCQPFHFWRSLGMAACLLVASLAPCRPRGRLVTGLVVWRRLVKSNLLLIINLGNFFLFFYY